MRQKLNQWLRQAKEPIWTRTIVALAIAAYILCLGGIWGCYGGIALYSIGIDELNYVYLGLFYPVVIFGCLALIAGKYVVFLLWTKNRILAYVVIGMALVSYGIAIIGGGIHLGLLIPPAMAIILSIFIICGLFFIGPGLAFIVAAYLEHKKKIDTGLDFTEMHHQGVTHTQPGANDQMNRNYYPTQAYV